MSPYVLLIFCFVVSAFAQDRCLNGTFQAVPALLRAAKIGASSVTVNDAKKDSLGNIYVTGQFQGTIFPNVSSSNSNMFLLKFNSNLNVEWVRMLQASIQSVGNSLAFDSSDNIYVVGQFAGIVPSLMNSVSSSDDVLLAKYSPFGLFQWARSAGSIDSDKGNSVAVDAVGNVVITGSFRSNISIGNTVLTLAAGNVGIFVAEYTTNGGFVWAIKTECTPFFFAYIEGTSIATDSSLNVVVIGTFTGNCSFQGTQLVSASGYTDAFLAKYTTSGSLIWVRREGGSFSSDSAISVTVDAVDSIYMLGAVGSGGLVADVALNPGTFLAKYTANGVSLWARSLAQQSPFDKGAMVLSNHSILIAANTYSSNTFEGRIVSGGYIAAYSSSGLLLYAHTIGARVFGLAVFENQTVVVGGYFGNATYNAATIFLDDGRSNGFAYAIRTCSPCEPPAVSFSNSTVAPICTQNIFATCYGISSINPSVCSQHGTCISNNNCVCQNGWSGNICDNNCPGWRNGDFGATTPVVRLQDWYGSIYLYVTYSKLPNRLYGTSFNKGLSCASASSNVNFWINSQTSCTITYSSGISFNSILALPNTTVVPSGADVFDVIANLYMYYIDTTHSCSLTIFETPITIKAFIQGTSYTAFDSNMVAIATIRQDRIMLTSTGLLEVQAIITMNAVGLLTSFNFAGSSNGIALSFTDIQHNPPTYTLVLRSSVSVPDFSGTYNITAVYNSTIPLVFVINLRYAAPLPPAPANTTLNTASTLWSPFYASRKNIFGTLESVWVLNEITQGITLGNRKLTVRNAYICCMRNREPMPSQGCSVLTAEMALQAQLISNEVPSSAQPWNVSPQSLQQLFRTGFSFSASGIGQQDRLCYVHVESFLKSQSRKKQQSDTVFVAYESLSFAAPKPNPEPAAPVNPKSSASLAYCSLLYVVMAVIAVLLL